MGNFRTITEYFSPLLYWSSSPVCFARILFMSQFFKAHGRKYAYLRERVHILSLKNRPDKKSVETWKLNEPIKCTGMILQVLIFSFLLMGFGNGSKLYIVCQQITRTLNRKWRDLTSSAGSTFSRTTRANPSWYLKAIHTHTFFFEREYTHMGTK